MVALISRLGRSAAEASPFQQIYKAAEIAYGRQLSSSAAMQSSKKINPEQQITDQRVDRAAFFAAAGFLLGLTHGLIKQSPEITEEDSFKKITSKIEDVITGASKGLLAGATFGAAPVTFGVTLGTALYLKASIEDLKEILKESKDKPSSRMESANIEEKYQEKYK